MDQQSRLSRAIGRVYDAAVDQQQWPAVLQDICDLCELDAAFLCFTDRCNRRTASRLVIRRCHPDRLAAYIDNLAWHEQTGKTVAASAKTREPHERSPRCCYFYRRAKCSNEVTRLISVSPNDYLTCELTLYRPAGIATDGRQYNAVLREIGNHIKRAAAIGFDLRTIAILHAAVLETLEPLPVALVVFGRGARLLHANAAALALTAEDDGVSLTPGGVRLSRAADQARLDTLVERALASAEPAASANDDTMALPRPSGGRPLSIRVSSITSDESGLSAVRPRGVIVMTDPDAKYDAPLARVRRLFSLSAAEGRLALALADGTDLRSAARAQSIHYETARKYLSAIFRKTGTRRQAELVRLLSVTLPCLVGHD